MVLDNDRFLKSELSNITQMLEEHFRVALSASKMVANAVTDWDARESGNGIVSSPFPSVWYIPSVVPSQTNPEESSCRILILPLANSPSLITFLNTYF